MDMKFDTAMGAQELVTLPLYEGVSVTEASGDYTLPDYQPEVRRILHVGTQILSPAKYVTGNRAELNGSVEYTVLYVGMDGELYSVPLSAEYSASLPLEDTSGFDLSEGVVLMADLTCESVNTRLTAPRRISIKSRLRAKVAAYGKKELREDMAGIGTPETVQRLCREGKGMTVTEGLSEIITLEHSLPLPAENARVVTADAAVFPEKSQCTQGRVTSVGRVECRLLCAMEDELGTHYETVTFGIPFEVEVEYDLPSSEGEHVCRVSGRVGELSVNAAEGDIQCRMGVILDARIFCPQSVRYTEDLYSTERTVQCGYEEASLPVLRACAASNLSQSERLSLSGLNLPEGTEAVTVFGRASADEVSYEKGKSVLSGRSHYTLVCRKEDELSAMELMLPFRFEWDTPEEVLDGLCAVEVISPKVKVEGDTLMLDAELSIAAALLGRHAIRRVRSADFGETLPPRDQALIVCYPSAEDTAWSVAKRYAVAPDRVFGNPETDRYVMVR